MIIGYIQSLIFLIWLSLEDIREKAVSIWKLIVFSMGEILWVVIDCYRYGGSSFSIFYGFIPGVLICLFAGLTGEVGLGDGIVIAFLGLHYGCMEVFRILAIGVVFLWIYMAVNRMSDSRHAFIPFLTLGMLFVFAAGIFFKKIQWRIA